MAAAAARAPRGPTTRPNPGVLNEWATTVTVIGRVASTARSLACTVIVYVPGSRVVRMRRRAQRDGAA